MKELPAFGDIELMAESPSSKPHKIPRIHWVYLDCSIPVRCREVLAVGTPRDGTKSVGINIDIQSQLLRVQ